MNKYRNHKIVAVKATSFVDSGIAQLVTILNEIPNVSTFSSCEGRIRRKTDDAHVYMSYGETRKQTWYSMGKFASKLAKILGQNGSYDTEVSLEWIGDKEIPFISLKIHPRNIAKATKIINDHKSELIYDT